MSAFYNLKEISRFKALTFDTDSSFLKGNGNNMSSQLLNISLLIRVSVDFPQEGLCNMLAQIFRRGGFYLYI
jgi:hypothetical protein